MCWADMTFSDRTEWFAFHGDELARARGTFVAALDAYARVLRASAATERNLSVEQFSNQVLDTADAALAEEVATWLGV